MESEQAILKSTVEAADESSCPGVECSTRLVLKSKRAAVLFRKAMTLGRWSPLPSMLSPKTSLKLCSTGEENYSPYCSFKKLKLIVPQQLKSLGTF